MSLAVGFAQSVTQESRSSGVVVNKLPVYTEDQLRLWKLRLELLGGNEDIVGFTSSMNSKSTDFWQEEVRKYELEQQNRTEQETALLINASNTSQTQNPTPFANHNH